MEVHGGQQALVSLLDPVELGRALASGAVAIEAGVVEDGLGGAQLTLVEMAAEGGGAAAFEIVQDPVLLGREVAAGAESWAVGAKDGVDLEGRRRGSCAVGVHLETRLGLRVLIRGEGGSDVWGDGVEWRRGRGDQPGADVDVAGSGADGGVAEQDLDDAQIGAGFQAVGSKGVAH